MPGRAFPAGPVLDASGRLIGITFGYKDEGRERLIYAYHMSRVRSRAFRAVQKRENSKPNQALFGSEFAGFGSRKMLGIGRLLSGASILGRASSRTRF